MTAYSSGFASGWQHGRGHEITERQRQAELNQPLPRNNPELLKPVRVRVVRPFCIGGKRVEPGQVVELPRHDADSMIAIGRAEKVK